MIHEIFLKISADIKIELNPRLFTWDKQKIDHFRDAAVQNNFIVMKETGSTGLVNVVVTGPIEEDPKWVSAEPLLNDGSWTKSAYLSLDDSNKFAFTLVKRGNYISFSKDSNEKIQNYYCHESVLLEIFLNKC